MQMKTQMLKDRGVSESGILEFQRVWESGRGRFSQTPTLREAKHNFLALYPFLVEYQVPLTGTDFTNIDTTHLDLRNLNFSKGEFIGLSFQFSNFEDCDFTDAKFKCVDLNGAKLCRCIFKQTVLEEVDFSFADLRWADFRESNMQSVGFENSNCSWANFSDLDLSRTYGVETLFLHSVGFKFKDAKFNFKTG